MSMEDAGAHQRPAFFFWHMIGQRVAALVPVYLPGPAPLVQRQPGCKRVLIPGMAVSPAGQSHSHQVNLA